VDGHDRQHHHAWVGKHLGGLVGLERHRAQGGGQGVAAVPQPPGRVELEAAAILLGVDHHHPGWTDRQVDAPIVIKWAVLAVSVPEV
jgi:hypothetical protein